MAKAIFDQLQQEGEGKETPHLTIDQIRLVIKMVLEVMIAVTVQGEAFRFGDYFTIYPRIVVSSNTRISKKHRLSIEADIVPGYIWKNTFREVLEMLQGLINWEEVKEHGTGEIRIRTDGDDGPEEQDGLGDDVPEVREKGERASAFLPRPWLRALRRAQRPKRRR